MTSACHAEDHGFKSRTDRHFFGSIAQSVEQRTENPCVTGSIPVGATIYLGKIDSENRFFLENSPKKSKKNLFCRKISTFLKKRH